MMGGLTWQGRTNDSGCMAYLDVWDLGLVPPGYNHGKLRHKVGELTPITLVNVTTLSVGMHAIVLAGGSYPN